MPNLKERTVMFIVESDLDFISGPSEVSIGMFISTGMESRECLIIH